MSIGVYNCISLTSPRSSRRSDQADASGFSSTNDRACVSARSRPGSPPALCRSPLVLASPVHHLSIQKIGLSIHLIKLTQHFVRNFASWSRVNCLFHFTIFYFIYLNLTYKNLCSDKFVVRCIIFKIFR